MSVTETHFLALCCLPRHGPAHCKQVHALGELFNVPEPHCPATL